MTINPALLGTLVALQGAKLSQTERTTAVATGLALGASNLVAGFMVGRGAVAESSLTAEKTAHATLRADFERLEREHAASNEKLEPSRKLAQALRELPENVRKQLPAADLEAFLSAFPTQGDDIAQRGEVERSPKSHALSHVQP
jgi:hypothetical protein